MRRGVRGRRPGPGLAVLVPVLVLVLCSEPRLAQNTSANTTTTTTTTPTPTTTTMVRTPPPRHNRTTDCDCSGCQPRGSVLRCQGITTLPPPCCLDTLVFPLVFEELNYALEIIGSELESPFNLTGLLQYGLLQSSLQKGVLIDNTFSLALTFDGCAFDLPAAPPLVLPPDSVESLSVSVTISGNHKLTRLVNGSFGGFGPSLASLTISECPLSTIEPGAFFGLFLGSLAIRNCLLSELDLGAMGNLVLLDTLDLEGNLLTTAPQLGGTGAVSLILSNNLIGEVTSAALNSSTNIRLDHNLLTSLPDFLLAGSFVADFSFAASHNRIAHISPAVFANASFASLDLSFNNLTTLDGLLLGATNNGYVLALSLAGNQLATIPPAARWVSDAALVNTLNVSHNRLSHLGPLELPALSQFSAAHNALTSIDPAAFAGSQLAVLDLSGNLLTPASLATNLTFTTSGFLRLLSLANNRLTTLDLALFNETSFNVLDLSGNNLTSFEAPSAVVLANSLRLSDNLLDEASLTIDLSGVSSLLLDGNRFTSGLLHSSTGPDYITTLDLSRNLITELPEGALSSFEDLRTLSLSENQLTSLGSGAFSGIQLNFLALSGNRLTEIMPGAFRGLVNLQVLDLSRNRLTEVKADWWGEVFSSGSAQLSTYYYPTTATQSYYFPQRSVVNLTYNPFTYFQKNAFLPLPAFVQVLLVAPHQKPLGVTTCCGLSWLVESGSRYRLAAGIVCPGGRRLVHLVQATPTLLCPTCFNNTHRQDRVGSLEDCIRLSERKVVGTTCTTAKCPAGTRLEPLGQGNGQFSFECHYKYNRGPENNPARSVTIIESICRECAVTGCKLCPKSARGCGACFPPLVLYKDTCVATCPRGYVGLPGANGAVCEVCAEDSCAACPNGVFQCVACRAGTRLFEGFCATACPASHYGANVAAHGNVPEGLVCKPCRHGCAQCTASDPCVACAGDLLLLARGGNETTCVAECPPGFRDDSSASACVPLSQISERSGRRESLEYPLIGTFLGLALVAGLAWVVYRKRRRRFHRLESELREQLLGSHEEVLALKTSWTINPDELSFQRVIGQGAFGEVWEARWGDTPVAVKRVHNAEVYAALYGGFNEFDAEIEFMRTLRHPNLVVFFGAGLTLDGHPYLVTELMARGSLEDLLASAPEISWQTKWQFAADAAGGMAHLHSLGRLHRDLKSGNLLVTDRFRIKVADFGTARVLGADTANTAAPFDGTEAVSSLTKCVGTPLWMAPEVLAGEPYNESADVYSYGIVLFEIAAQRLPWSDIKGDFIMNALLRLIRDNQRPELPPDTPADFQGLATICWATNPAERPSFAHITRQLLARA